jgi:hypothetical protein
MREPAWMLPALMLVAVVGLLWGLVPSVWVVLCSLLALTVWGGCVAVAAWWRDSSWTEWL